MKRYPIFIKVQDIFFNLFDILILFPSANILLPPDFYTDTYYNIIKYKYIYLIVPSCFLYTLHSSTLTQLIKWTVTNKTVKTDLNILIFCFHLYKHFIPAFFFRPHLFISNNRFSLGRQSVFLLYKYKLSYFPWILAEVLFYFLHFFFSY